MSTRSVADFWPQRPPEPLAPNPVAVDSRAAAAAEGGDRSARGMDLAGNRHPDRNHRVRARVLADVERQKRARARWAPVEVNIFFVEVENLVPVPNVFPSEEFNLVEVQNNLVEVQNVFPIQNVFPSDPDIFPDVAFVGAPRRRPVRRIARAPRRASRVARPMRAAPKDGPEEPPGRRAAAPESAS